MFRRNLCSSVCIGAAAFLTSAAMTFAGGECGPACGKANVECLTGAEFANSRIVGQLRGFPGGPGFCTAWIVAGPDCLITNDHCSPAIGDIVAFNYECTTCQGGECKPVDEYQVIEVVECNAAQDWCLFRVNGNVAALYGQATIDPSPAFVNMPIYEIHHAEGEKKGYDDGQVLALFQNVGCPGSIPEHSVSVIASQGASGSPVFRSDNHCVTAICNCGPPCAPGFVIPMSTAWPNIAAAIDNQTNCNYQLCGQVEPCGPGSGPCDQPNGTPGCNDVACCELICGQDPFCCDTEWDQICADAAIKQCAPPGPCGPGAGPCDQPNGTPGCDDVTCCELICAQDAFCCDTEWDQICADAAIKQCFGPCGPGAGPCDEPNGTPGCDDIACCQKVCAQDSFCCDTEWDQICANLAIDLCGLGTGACCLNGQCSIVTESECLNAGGEFFGVGSVCQPGLCNVCGPGAGPCDQANGTPGCDDVKCCELICAQDPFCCENTWDQICADSAIKQCFKEPTGACCVDNECVIATQADCFNAGGKYFGDGSACSPDLCAPPNPCGPGAGPCDIPNGTPGCDDVACCKLICSQDPFCCDVEWDQICADAAIEQCFAPTGACCVGSDCLEVTAPECADLGGDYFGDGTACTPDLCAVDPCNPLAGSCFEPNGTPGCDEIDCCQAVCDVDPFCCDVEWDQICVDAANDLCLAPPTGACCIDFECFIVTEEECGNAGGKYFGDGTDCAPGVCDEPFPCPGAGPCGQANGSPGCDEQECCELVCGKDPFCCDVEWDQICADAAVELCGACPCAWDLDGDCDVDSADLANLLAAWNQPFGPADLAALLAEWGCN